MPDYTKLADGLYIGGAPKSSLGFDVIVLCAEEYQPENRLLAPATVVRVPLEDSFRPLSKTSLATLSKLSKRLAEVVRSGTSVLVSCALGRNRSALVSALVLSELYGVSAKDAGAFVRKARKDRYGVSALENAYFRQLLGTWKG